MVFAERPYTPSTECPRKKQKLELQDRAIYHHYPDCGSPSSVPFETGLEELSTVHSGNSRSENENRSPSHAQSSCQDSLVNTECVDTPKKICFGTLCEIACQLLPSRGGEIGSILRTLQKLGDPKPLMLKFADDCCTISHEDVVPIGLINRKTAAGLKSLKNLDQLRFQAFLNSPDLENVLSQYGAGENRVGFTVDINVFGLTTIAETVASQLSAGRLFLQRPRIALHPDVEYWNPQYLESVETLENDDDEPLYLSAFEGTSPGSVYLDPSAFEDQVRAVMDNLTRPSYLDATSITSSVIIADLMPHQKDVVNFVVAREKCSNTVDKTDLSLWQEEFTDDGYKFFRHAITGSKSSTPSDALGGILADDMGLGKTLSMIASVASTLSDARDYALCHNANLPNSPVAFTQATLVVVPSALILDGWIDEIKKHVASHAIKWHKYHGLARTLDTKDLSSYHIVFTTYGTVAADCARKRGLLDHIVWYRIILDEAHVIRNWSTKQFEAIYGLSARNRWCMTGTPIQNSLDDLGALVRFLRLPLLEEITSFRRFISSASKLDNLPKLSDLDNLAKLLKSICLRNTNALLKLPGVVYEECRPDMTAIERKQYNQLIRACHEALEKPFRRQFTMGKGNASVLECLLDLRMYCNQGLKPVQTSLSQNDVQDEILSLLLQSEDAVCAYCQCDILTLPAASGAPGAINYASHITRCHKIICAECIAKQAEDPSEPAGSYLHRCAVCQGAEASSDCPCDEKFATRQDLNEFPTKLLALQKNVQSCLKEEKCMIFTFWQKSIDRIAQLLDESGISFARLDGSTSRAQRKKSLDGFRNNESIRVLLATFGTGSTGLNDLSMASTIHIVEPQWNPSIESQSVGRILRHGQTRRVRVIRYIMRNTIEEAVENRQLRKMLVAHGSGLSTENGGGRGMNSNNDKRTYVALREHLFRYMNSDDFQGKRNLSQVGDWTCHLG